MNCANPQLCVLPLEDSVPLVQNLRIGELGDCPVLAHGPQGSGSHHPQRCSRTRDVALQDRVSGLGGDGFTVGLGDPSGLFQP